MKLLIAIPSNRDWKGQFCVCLINLALSLKGSDIDAELLPTQNASLLSNARQHALNVAISQNMTHILFIDDDMGFNIEAFEILKGRDKDFIAANALTKYNKATSVNKEGGSVFSSGKTGIESILFSGMGFVLIKLEKIKNISPPHFEIRWNDQTNTYWSEDFFFCHTLRQNGIEIFVDHDAARHVVHVGNHSYQEDFS